MFRSKKRGTIYVLKAKGSMKEKCYVFNASKQRNKVCLGALREETATW